MIEFLNRIKLAWAMAGAIGGATAVAHFVAPEVEEWRYARYVFVFSRLWFEALVLLLLCTLWATYATWREGLSKWLRSIGIPWSSHGPGSSVRILTVVCAMSTLVALGYILHGYARARYAYVLKDMAQREFRQTQMDRATRWEAVYDYGHAIAIYKSLLATAPVGRESYSLERRVALLKGLLDHAGHLQMLESEADARGSSRDAFRLLVERVRINPTDEVAARKLNDRIGVISRNLSAAEEFDRSCRAGTNPRAEEYKEALSYALEQSAHQGMVTSSKKQGSPTVCEVLGRFSDTQSAREMMNATWQLKRAMEVGKLPQLLRSGAYERPKLRPTDGGSE